MNKEEVITSYRLNKKQSQLIQFYLTRLGKINKNFNLVGQSTIKNAWDRHINDSLQLTRFIKNKESSIIDLGTGAGLPGLVLNIFGYKNILLVDSKQKKINFIRGFSKESKLEIKNLCSRVENIKDQKFDHVVCRALAPLPKILDYSLIFTKKNTSLLFLKGRNVKKEIQDAKIYFSFQHKLFESKSAGEGFVLMVTKLKRK